MAAAWRAGSGSLLAAVLGVAALAAWPFALAQAPAAALHDHGAREEVLITATRQTDEALTAKVVEALHDDPYIYADHMSVVTENGIVRLQGIALDMSELHRALTLARRIAGRRRVVNEVELRESDFHD